MTNNRLILASTSPRRAQLLNQLNIDFTVINPGNAENSKSQDPKERTIENSLSKAKAVAKTTDSGIVIGIDTVVYLEGEILEKPNNSQHAKEMLRKISGKIHTVISTITLIDTSKNNTHSQTEETQVKIRELTEEEIKLYVASGEPFDKAGSYAAQGIGAIFIERVDGCFYNVVGLPLALLNKMLINAGFNILK